MQDYAVFGNPIKHSLSPQIHSIFAEQTGQDMEYRAILAPQGEFAKTASAFFMSDEAMGANVTVPFKEEALVLADSLSEKAQIAGAANTLIKQEDGTLHADNTDGVGLVADLLANKLVIKDKKVLIIGAGGAARGVIVPLLEQGVASLTITNRTYSRAQVLTQDIAMPGLMAMPIDELKPEFDIIINSTAASLEGKLPGVDDKVLANAHACYDMVYASDDTAFIAHARVLGVKTCLDGLGMLVEQAAEAFYLWRGIRPDSRQALKEMKQRLQSAK